MDAKSLNEYSYTLGTPVKRTVDDILSPSDTGSENPTSRMKEYTSPGIESEPTRPNPQDNPHGCLKDQDQVKDQVKAVLCDPSVMQTICLNVCKAFEHMLSPLTESIKQQTLSITNLTSELGKQNKDVQDMRSENESLKHRISVLEENVAKLESELEAKIDNLEQYGRRSSIRFVNVNKKYQMTTKTNDKQLETTPPSNVSMETTTLNDQSDLNTQTQSDDPKPKTVKSTYENIILDICNNKINVQPPITEDDIERCHPVGQEKDGKIQLLCKFKNWKLKHRVFSQKSNLKNKTSDNFKVFLAEDLTQKRRRMVSALNEARKAGVINTYWTTDGRIYFKKTENSTKTEIKEFDNNNILEELYKNANPWNDRSTVNRLFRDKNAK